MFAGRADPRDLKPWRSGRWVCLRVLLPQRAILSRSTQVPLSPTPCFILSVPHYLQFVSGDVIARFLLR